MTPDILTENVKPVTIQATGKNRFLLTIRDNEQEITGDELAQVCIVGARILADNKVKVNKRTLMGIGKTAEKNIRKGGRQ